MQSTTTLAINTHFTDWRKLVPVVFFLLIESTQLLVQLGVVSVYQRFSYTIQLFTESHPDQPPSEPVASYRVKC